MTDARHPRRGRAAASRRLALGLMCAAAAACPAATACYAADAAAAPELLGGPPKQECAGPVPACATFRGDLLTVRRGDKQRIRITCPAGARYFWNWSAAVGRHVQADLLETIQDAKEHPVGATFIVHEEADANPGQARIDLGCSAQPPSDKHPIRFRYGGFGWHPHQ